MILYTMEFSHAVRSALGSRKSSFESGCLAAASPNSLQIQSVYLLSIHLPIYLPTYLSIYLSIYIHICNLSVYLSIHLSVGTGAWRPSGVRPNRPLPRHSSQDADCARRVRGRSRPQGSQLLYYMLHSGLIMNYV